MEFHGQIPPLPPAFHKDDPHYEDIIKNATCKLLTFGVEKEADVKGNDIEHVTRGGGSVHEIPCVRTFGR